MIRSVVLKPLTENTVAISEEHCVEDDGSRCWWVWCGVVHSKVLSRVAVKAVEMASSANTGKSDGMDAVVERDIESRGEVCGGEILRVVVVARGERRRDGSRGGDARVGSG